jgi:hypothetical protein
MGVILKKGIVGRHLTTNSARYPPADGLPRFRRQSSALVCAQF